jgi:streptogrisin C
MWPCNNQAPQKFQFTTTHLEPQKGPLGAGQLKTSNNKCLAVAGGSKANGAAVQIATCSGNAAQQWLFSASAPGEIVNLPAKRCLDIKDWNGNNGAKLQLWDCAGTLNQLWHKG